MALALPTSSTSTNTEEDDTVQVVVPDKRRILSDIKALVDYHDTQIQMAQRETQQLQNQLAMERNRVSHLQAENEDMKQKLDRAEESVITMQQEKSEHETQMDLLKSQVQSLQNQLREGQKQTNSLLNITKSHASHVRRFLKNFNETEKDLITLFPGCETSSSSASTSVVASSSSAEIPTSSVESSLPILKLKRPHGHKHKHNKRLKNKPFEGTKKIAKLHHTKSKPRERMNVEAECGPSTNTNLDLDVVEESEELPVLIQLEKDIDSAFNRGDNQRVLDLSTRGTRLTEDNSMFRILKVHALTNLGRIQEAQEESTKILQIENIMDEMNAFALCTMAYCFYQADKLDTCLEYYRHALIKEPGNETAKKYLPKIKAIRDLRATAKGNGTGDVEIFKKCLELLNGVDDIGNRVIESKLSYLCAINTTEDRITSMEFVNKAISCSPKFAKAIFQRAKLFLLEKKYHDALKDLQEVLRLDPELPGIQSLIDACQRSMGRERPSQIQTLSIMGPPDELD